MIKYDMFYHPVCLGVIDKNAYSGVENLLNDINAALLAEVDRTNLKHTRRRRRGRISKCEVPDVLPSQVYPDKVKDIHKATQIPPRKLSTKYILSHLLYPSCNTCIQYTKCDLVQHL